MTLVEILLWFTLGLFVGQLIVLVVRLVYRMRKKKGPEGDPASFFPSIIFLVRTFSFYFLAF